MRRLAPLLFVTILLGCTGDAGPMGPQGPQGDPGIEGAPGEVAEGQILRRVYEGKGPIPRTKDHTYRVAVPDITLDDMPMIGVYVGDDGDWYEIPAELGKWGFDMEAIITEGGVTFVGCDDWQYKIVIIK